VFIVDILIIIIIIIITKFILSQIKLHFIKKHETGPSFQFDERLTWFHS